MKSGFVYFLADRNGATITPGVIESHGLGHAFDRPPAVCGCPNAGPNGRPGVVFGDSRRVDRIGYYPDAQKWRQGVVGDAWVGMVGNPGPDDLVRDKIVDGHLVELGDGRRWLVPVPRQAIPDDGVSWSINVTREMTLGTDGKWDMGPVVAKYRRLWDICAGYFDARLGGLAAAAETNAGTIEFDFGMFPDLAAAATAVLEQNYVIGTMEAAMLGLWNTDTVQAVMDAASDYSTVETWLKKKATEQIAAASDGAPSEPGVMDDSPDTDQH